MFQRMLIVVPLFFFDLSKSVNCSFFMLKNKEKGGDSIAQSMATVPETVNVTSKITIKNLYEEKGEKS